ncbi:ankyrin repeat domain-containing protein [Archangium gephyra]|uniref:ankyrin repeat domain-containing protein n=1 Tax=Archangium gephyra TaxID=48 RepID=UPI003B7FAC3D
MRLPGLLLTLLAVLMWPSGPVRAEDVSGRPRRGRADALHAAVVRGDRALVRQLLEAGAEPNAPDARAATPLMLAPDAPMVELLVAGGANARAEDAQGRTLVGRIVEAASRERPSVQLLRAVVRAGADVDRAHRAGETPLEVAARRGDLELVRELLSLGARVPGALERTAIRVALPVSSGAGVRLAEEWGWHGRELVFRRLHVRLLTSAAEAVPVPLELGSPLSEALTEGEVELAVEGPDGQPAPAEVAQQTESVMQVSDEGPHVELHRLEDGPLRLEGRARARSGTLAALRPGGAAGPLPRFHARRARSGVRAGEPAALARGAAAVSGGCQTVHPPHAHPSESRLRYRQDAGAPAPLRLLSLEPANSTCRVGYTTPDVVPTSLDRFSEVGREA